MRENLTQLLFVFCPLMRRFGAFRYFWPSRGHHRRDVAPAFPRGHFSDPPLRMQPGLRICENHGALTCLPILELLSPL
jgi:hypothetical protein